MHYIYTHELAARLAAGYGKDTEAHAKQLKRNANGVHDFSSRRLSSPVSP